MEAERLAAVHAAEAARAAEIAEAGRQIAPRDEVDAKAAEVERRLATANHRAPQRQRLAQPSAEASGAGTGAGKRAWHCWLQVRLSHS